MAGGSTTARGATVTVLDPEGRTIAGALVMCVAPEKERSLTDTDAAGLAIVLDACASVRCELGGYLPGEAALKEGTATCRLAAGVRVSIAVDRPGCADYFHVGLVPVEPAGDPVIASRLEPARDSEGCVARLRPVSPGRYELQVANGQGWTCRAPVVLPVQEDDHVLILHATWRAPLEMTGTVLDEEGRPVGDIPMRVRGAAGIAPPQPGEWRCASSGGIRADVFTADDGTFRVPVDPTLRVLIEAGSSWDPDGFASVEVGPQQEPAGPVVLRLRE
jgi:hypothetical protein